MHTIAAPCQSRCSSLQCAGVKRIIKTYMWFLTRNMIKYQATKLRYPHLTCHFEINSKILSFFILLYSIFNESEFRWYSTLFLNLRMKVKWFLCVSDIFYLINKKDTLTWYVSCPSQLSALKIKLRLVYWLIKHKNSNIFRKSNSWKSKRT